jgi:hypothetical protein
MAKGNGIIKIKEGRIGCFDYKFKLKPDSHSWIQYLKTTYGASPTSTVDNALLIHKEVIRMQKIPSDAQFKAMMKNSMEVSDEIIEYITTKNLSKEEMKDYIKETIFQSLAKNTTKKKIGKHRNLAKRSVALP